MSTIFAPSNNTFGFVCNCGFSRFVTDAEINFRCERPVLQATELRCTFFYNQTPNGGGSGIPTVKRVNASGVDQSDNASVVTSGRADMGGASMSNLGSYGVDAIVMEGAIG